MSECKQASAKTYSCTALQHVTACRRVPLDFYLPFESKEPSPRDVTARLAQLLSNGACIHPVKEIIVRLPIVRCCLTGQCPSMSFLPSNYLTLSWISTSLLNRCIAKEVKGTSLLELAMKSRGLSFHKSSDSFRSI